MRAPLALRGKTRGDGSEPAEDEGPLDIDAAIDEALKSPSIVDAISEDINAALGKDDAKTPEEISALTRTMLNDPRLTQCSMAGAGMTLTVEESDLQKAERLGDLSLIHI